MVVRCNKTLGCVLLQPEVLLAIERAIVEVLRDGPLQYRFPQTTFVTTLGCSLDDVYIHQVPPKKYFSNGLATADAFNPTKRKAPLVRGLVKLLIQCAIWFDREPDRAKTVSRCLVGFTVTCIGIDGPVVDLKPRSTAGI